MIDIMTLFKQVLLLVMMLIPGVIMCRLKFGGKDFAKGIANLVLYIAQPAMIVHPFIRNFEKRLLGGILGVLVFSFIAHFLFLGIAMLLFGKTEEQKKNVLRFAILFSNSGYMGIPLIEALLGGEAAIYATVFNVAFHFFVWSVGCYIYTGDKKYISPRKMLLNPATISVYIGVLIFILPINTLIPEVAVSAAEMLKNLVAPLSMLLVGYHMANADFKGRINSGDLWLSIFTRLIVCPAAVFILIKLVQLAGIYDNYSVATVVLLASATPAATATSMFAEKFDGDTATSGVLVPLSTICAVATMPLMALLLKLY